MLDSKLHRVSYPSAESMLDSKLYRVSCPSAGIHAGLECPVQVLESMLDFWDFSFGIVGKCCHR